jgi:hypothetical protein
VRGVVRGVAGDRDCNLPLVALAADQAGLSFCAGKGGQEDCQEHRDYAQDDNELNECEPVWPLFTPSKLAASGVYRQYPRKYDNEYKA